MSPLLLRRFVLLIFVSAIAGMIFGSIKDNNGVAITFGLTSAVAALALILVATVAPPETFKSAGHEDGANDESAAEVEARISALVKAGADEHELRVLVQKAIELARTARSTR